MGIEGYRLEGGSSAGGTGWEGGKVQGVQRGLDSIPGQGAQK